MAIQYLKHNDLDLAKWDECIDRAKNHMIYAYSWYLNYSCENWDALVLNDYEAVMPLPWKNKFGLQFIYHPFFSQQLGVFYTKTPYDIAEFIKLIPFKFLKYNIVANHCNCSAKLKQLEKKNFLLSLQKPYSELLAGYDSKCRRNVKLSKKEDLTIKTELAVELLIALKKENAKTTIHEQQYTLLNSLLKHLLAKNKAQVLGVFNNNNKLIGAAAFVFSKNRIIYLFSASDAEGIKKRAMYLILNNIIENNAENELLLDFEGSMIASIARFFRGFGGHTETYFQMQKSKIPFLK